ncbi:unnamed protein product [Closterium sp. Naga37s-1]|nr:unnamed protein product [Closterium sp. Naga37s-1]
MGSAPYTGVHGVPQQPFLVLRASPAFPASPPPSPLLPTLSPPFPLPLSPLPPPPPPLPTPPPPSPPSPPGAQVNVGLIKVFNGFGPKAPDLAYWGYTGCLNNHSWIKYAEETQYAKPWMTNAWLAFVDGQDRPMIEKSLGCEFQSINSLEAKVSARKDCYVVNLFQFSPFFNWPQCTDYSDRFGEGCSNLNTKWKSRGSPPYRFRNGHIGFSELEEAGIGFKKWAAGFRFSEFGAGVCNSTAMSFTMYDITNASNPLMVFGDSQPATGSNPIYPMVLPTPIPLGDKPATGSNPIYPMVLPAPIPPGDKVVQPFPDDFIGRRYEGHCRYRHPPPVWGTLFAPMLLGLLVLLVAVLLTFIIVSLARKKARIRQQMAEVEEYTLALEQAERSKSEFVANLSHELRTPITGMLGMMDWLLESSLSEWQHRDLLDAKMCAVEAIGLLNSVLDLAKLQANRLVLEAFPFSPHQCADLAVRALMPDAHKKNLQFMVRMHASVPDVLIGDPTRVGQVMRELISHAIRNTVSGRVILHLWCVPAPVPVQAIAEAAEPDLEAWIQGLEVRGEAKEIEGGVYGGKVAAAANEDTHIEYERQREELLARMKRSGSAECCGAAARDAGGDDSSSSEDAANGPAAARGIGCFGSRQSSGREMGGSGRNMGGRNGSLNDCCEASFRYSLAQNDPRFSDLPMNAYIQSAGAGSSTSASANTHTPNEHAPPPIALSLLTTLPGRLLKRVMGAGGGDSASGKSRGGKGFQDAWTPYPVRFLLSASLDAWTPYPVRFLLSASLVSDKGEPHVRVSLMRGCMGVATQEHVGSTIMVSVPMKTRHVAPPTAAAEDGEDDVGEEDGEEEWEEKEEGEWEEEGMEEALAWVEMKWGTREVVEGRRALVVDGDDARAEPHFIYSPLLHLTPPSLSLHPSPANCSPPPSSLTQATVTALRYLGMQAAVVGTQEEATRTILGRQPEAAWRFAEKRMGEARRRAKRGKGREEGAGEGNGEGEAKGEEVGQRDEKGESKVEGERKEEAEKNEQEEQAEQVEQEEQEEQEEEKVDEMEGPWDVVFVEADAFNSGVTSKPRGSITDAGAQSKPGNGNGSDAVAGKSGIGFGRRIKFDHRSLVLFHSASAAARAPGPGCAGVSYARALAAGFADTLPQPCLVADLAQALAAGFADTLPQPCLVADLAQCLHAVSGFTGN